MTTALPTDLLQVVCKEPTGKRRHAACLKARRQAQREHRPLLIIHLYRQRRRGADLTLDVRATRPLSAPVRAALDAKFEVWSLCGWIGPKGVQVVHPTVSLWTRVPRTVLDAFVAELTSLLADRYWPSTRQAEAPREP